MSDIRVESSLEGETIQEHFLVERQHAKGGMAWIYQGRDLRDQSPVALKIMFAKWRKDPKVCERFLQEVRVHSQISHPNIIKVREHIEDGNLMGMAMEWVPGGDLKDLFESRDGPLTSKEIEEIFLPLIDAIGHAHKLGIVHRDLKPGNVLLSQEGGRVVPKVTDFGIAKVLSEPGVTFTGAKLGTPHYMAPEQWRDSKSVDHRADLYSLGVILYRFVTGKLPFEGDYQTIIIKLVDEPAPYPTGVPAPLAGVILRCLEKDPGERFDSCEVFSNTLRRVLSLDVPVQGGATLSLSPGAGGTLVDSPLTFTPGADRTTADPSLSMPAFEGAMSAAGPRVKAEFKKTAVWGQEDFQKALAEDELTKSLKKAEEAQLVAQEASLKTMALDSDDPILAQLQSKLEEDKDPAPLPLWLLVVLGLVMLAIGGLIGWFLSQR